MNWGRLQVNIEQLSKLTDAAMMAMVKADAYGHGAYPAGAIAVEAGATWLGVVTLGEASSLRRAGGFPDSTPIMAFLYAPEQSRELRETLGQNIHLGVSSIPQLETVNEAAAGAGQRVRIHVKADTGMSRGGSVESEWGRLLDLAAKYQAAGTVEVVGAWSHMACADEIGHPSNAAQKSAFARFLDAVGAVGLEPQVRHLANSAALISDPETHYDLVRPGIAIYGSNPVPSIPVPLRPVMELLSKVAAVKRIPAGTGVSYGHTFTAQRDTTLAQVPLGYADGIPRSASGHAEVYLAGKRRPIVGRICMDQFMVDCGDDEVSPGEEVILFGPKRYGPTADEWAAWAGTIPNEIFTGLGSRIPRAWNANAE